MQDWLPPAANRLLLVHEPSQEVIASSITLATTRKTRRVGLLGHSRLDPAAAMVLAPCFMVHTAFMRFPIDLLFVSEDGRTLRVVPGLKPWRAAAAVGAHAVVELAAGVLERHHVEVGDRLNLACRPFTCAADDSVLG